jgi:type IV pilus assembly protein PilO
MNALVDALMERPKWQRIAIWLGTLLFILYIFYQFFYASLSAEIHKIQVKVEKLNTDIVSESRLARELPKIKAAVKELDIKLKQLLLELPDKREIPSLLSSISSLAKDAGLEVSLFKPRAENIRDFYAEVPVSISVEGTFHQVATFFDEVGRLSRIVNITDIAITEPLETKTEKRVLTKTSCVATTFRYLDDEERARREAALNQKSKRQKR